MNDNKGDRPVEEMSFEEAMAELEAVVGQLERGAQLKARCEVKLREAEEKVAQITLDANGAPAGTTPVEGL